MSAAGSEGAAELTVLIVNWNARDELLRCLACLPAAVGELAAKVLVVDNASRDDSVTAVRATHPEVEVLASEENLGFAGGIAEGARWAEGPFLAVLNPDVYPEPGALALLVRELAEHPRAALAGPLVVDRNGREIAQDFSLPGVTAALRRMPGWAALRRVFGGPPSRRPRRVERVNGCCMVFRTAHLEEIGGMPRETFLYGEEIVLGGAFRTAGLEVRYVPAARVMHWDGASVDRLWSSGEKLLVFKAARILTARDVMGRGRFVLWNMIFLAREIVYTALRPVARLAGKPWPPNPLATVASLHLLGVASALSRGADERLRERYRSYAGRGREAAS